MNTSTEKHRSFSLSLLLTLFAIHAGAVCLLIADLSWTALHQNLSQFQMVLLSIAIVWLTASTALIVPGLKRGLTPGYILNGLLMGVTIIFMVGAAELALRVYSASVQARSRYGNYTPLQRYSTFVDGRIIPGIAGEVHFTTNELGMRGPSATLLKQYPNAYRIITLGGSTTECGLLDDEREWPQLLMQKLNEKQSKRFVFVGNMGVSGHNTVDHLAFLRAFNGPKEADMLTFLIGANDLGATLAFRGQPCDRQMRDRSVIGLQHVIPQKYPFYGHSKVYQALWIWRARTGVFRSHATADWVQERRDLRSKRSRVPLPDLRVGLEEYRAHILELAASCKEFSKRCVFITQPSIHRPDMKPAEDGLLWGGSVGPAENPDGHPTAADLAKATDKYNRTLLSVCAEAGLECYDAAPQLPKSTEAFYDDYHMNDLGAELFAEFLSNKLAGSVGP